MVESGLQKRSEARNLHYKNLEAIKHQDSKKENHDNSVTVKIDFISKLVLTHFVFLSICLLLLMVEWVIFISSQFSRSSHRYNNKVCMLVAK